MGSYTAVSGSVDCTCGSIHPYQAEGPISQVQHFERVQLRHVRENLKVEIAQLGRHGELLQGTRCTLYEELKELRNAVHHASQTEGFQAAKHTLV